MIIVRPAHQSWFTLHYVCACCWGDLGIDRDGPIDQFYCLEGEACSGKGFVTSQYAQRRLAESYNELQEVRRNYPDLDPHYPPEVKRNEKELLALLGFE